MLEGQSNRRGRCVLSMMIDSPHFGPGTSVILCAYPRGPVLTTLHARREGTEWVQEVAWLDQGNRCVAEYHERDLMKFQEAAGGAPWRHNHELNERAE